jgi:competence protein ComEC
LVFDISFQLSFLATIALIFFSPLVERKLQFITPKYKLRELIVATVATQIFVLPFILYKMGIFPVYALLANLLILPLIPTIMLLGFITGIISYLINIIAIPFAFICSLLLSFTLKVITFFAHLPFSAVTLQNFPLSLTILLYFIFLIIIVKNSYAQKKL